MALAKNNNTSKDRHMGLSYGPGEFTDEEFERAAREIANPNIAKYEFFVESHGTKIYRRYIQVIADILPHSESTSFTFVQISFHSRDRVCTSTKFMG